jgi:hypothetical protein
MLYMRVASVNLTREGISVSIQIIAKSWRQRWSKDEAVDLVASHLRHSEWTPLLTMWLGDGKTRRGRVLRSKYEVRISTKEPWKLGLVVSACEAVVATGREAFVKLREAAGVYGKLLDLLKTHKWIVVKLSTDKGFRAAYKLKKRGIDVLREAYKHSNGKIPTEWFSHAEKPKRGDVVVEGIVMSLYLVDSQGGSLLARRYVRDARSALAIAERLESAGLRPNVMRSGNYYVVYIAMSDLLKLAEKDDNIRRAIALYLAEKAKNGTPRRRKIAEKILQRHPIFQLIPSAYLKPTLPCISRYQIETLSSSRYTASPATKPWRGPGRRYRWWGYWIKPTHTPSSSPAASNRESP